MPWLAFGDASISCFSHSDRNAIISIVVSDYIFLTANDVELL